jgi:2,4-dienoyl-CoA reductase (NADPH2)
VVVGAGGVGVETALFLRLRERVPDPVRDFFLEYHAAGVDLGPGTLEALDLGGPEVTLVGRNRRLGVGLGPATRWVLLDELKRAGVRVAAGARAESITAEGVWVEREEGRELLPADTVVLASGYEPSSEVYEELRDSAPEVHLVGDAVNVDHATEGIARAMEVALQI